MDKLLHPSLPTNKGLHGPHTTFTCYATMYVDLDMVPNFLKLWYHFFNKINCGKKYIYDNELDKHVNTCLIISFSRVNRILSLLVIRFSKRFDKL